MFERREVLALLPATLVSVPVTAAAREAAPFAILRSHLEEFYGPLGDKHRVEILDQGREPNDKPYAVAAVTENAGWDWNVILFCSSDGGWKARAAVELESQRVAVPGARYYPNKHGLLMVQANGGAGTGVVYHATRWYRLDADAPTEIVNYPHYFMLDWGSVHREARLVRSVLPKDMPHGQKVSLAFEASCHRSNCEPSVARVQHAVELSWDEATGRFAQIGSGSLDEIHNWYAHGF
jgi:hypothetical protein